MEKAKDCYYGVTTAATQKSVFKRLLMSPHHTSVFIYW
uniref:Uncharacterized protein n=1 Tax=Anguilla anguilla TaxID=7936 RepID=A0A0E9TW78_ANGAN